MWIVIINDTAVLSAAVFTGEPSVTLAHRMVLGSVVHLLMTELEAGFRVAAVLRRHSEYAPRCKTRPATITELVAPQVMALAQAFDRRTVKLWATVSTQVVVAQSRVRDSMGLRPSTFTCMTIVVFRPYSVVAAWRGAVSSLIIGGTLALIQFMGVLTMSVALVLGRC